MPPSNPMSQADAAAVLQHAKQLLGEAATFTDKLFDKSQAYNNAIILAGFGGLFCIARCYRANTHQADASGHRHITRCLSYDLCGVRHL